MIITSLLISAERSASILVEHRALTEAIRAGELERAQTVLAAHLRGTLDLLPVRARLGRRRLQAGFRERPR